MAKLNTPIPFRINNPDKPKTTRYYSDAGDKGEAEKHRLAISERLERDRVKREVEEVLDDM